MKSGSPSLLRSGSAAWGPGWWKNFQASPAPWVWISSRAIASQTDAITVFEKNGFSQVATLKNFVKDMHQDEYQDIAILVKDLSQQ